MVGGSKVEIDALSEALSTRMNHWAVSKRRFQPLVYLSASRCAAATGRRALMC